jgi:hypothetical protein
MSEINEKKKTPKKSSLLNGLTIVSPQRKLPLVIKEAIERNIPVVLSKDGYYVKGFYGLNQETVGYKGYAFAQETSDFESVVFYDSKGLPVVVKSFKDLVKFNNDVWGSFFKLSEEYKRPDELWFNLMLSYDVLAIMPGGK